MKTAIRDLALDLSSLPRLTTHASTSATRAVAYGLRGRGTREHLDRAAVDRAERAAKKVKSKEPADGVSGWQAEQKKQNQKVRLERAAVRAAIAQVVPSVEVLSNQFPQLELISLLVRTLVGCVDHGVRNAIIERRELRKDTKLDKWADFDLTAEQQRGLAVELVMLESGPGNWRRNDGVWKDVLSLYGIDFKALRKGAAPKKKAPATKKAPIKAAAKKVKKR